MNKKNYLAIFAKSFNWAGFFLPKKIYENSAKLYAFCRVLDDIADEKTDLDHKIKKFNEMRNFLKKIYDADNKEIHSSDESEKIVYDVVTLAKNNNIKKIILDDLVDGVASDLKKRIHIRSVKDLLIYSYRVAGTVGLMMSKILKVNNREALKGAIDLGIAMQLTNIARDVCEDKARNRQYVKHDFSSIKEIIYESQIFYDKSFRSISSIPIKSRFSVIVARRIYRKIGDNILKQKNIENYNKAGKIYVPVYEKIIQTFLSFFDFIKLLFIKELSYENHANHTILEKEININEKI